MAETIFIKHYEDTDCLHGYGVERTVELTRQEAIERMAKGMYLLTNPEDTKYADFYNCYFFELAEAALNALLEEKDD